MIESIGKSASHLFGKVTIEDMVAAFGGGAQRSMSKTYWSLGLFAAGSFIGAGVALLLAPKSGKEFRRDVASTVSTLKDRVEHLVSQGQEAMGSKPTAAVTSVPSNGKSAHSV